MRYCVNYVMFATCCPLYSVNMFATCCPLYSVNCNNSQYMNMPGLILQNVLCTELPPIEIDSTLHKIHVTCDMWHVLILMVTSLMEFGVVIPILSASVRPCWLIQASWRRISVAGFPFSGVRAKQEVNLVIFLIKTSRRTWIRIVILICMSAQLFLLHKVICRLHVSTNKQSSSELYRLSHRKLI